MFITLRIAALFICFVSCSLSAAQDQNAATGNFKWVPADMYNSILHVKINKIRALDIHPPALSVIPLDNQINELGLHDMLKNSINEITLCYTAVFNVTWSNPETRYNVEGETEAEKKKRVEKAGNKLAPQISARIGGDTSRIVIECESLHTVVQELLDIGWLIDTGEEIFYGKVFSFEREKDSETFYAFVADSNYLLLSRNLNSLKKMILTGNAVLPGILQDRRYDDVIKNIPENSLHVYIDPQHLNNTASATFRRNSYEVHPERQPAGYSPDSGYESRKPLFKIDSTSAEKEIILDTIYIYENKLLTFYHENLVWDYSKILADEEKRLFYGRYEKKLSPHLKVRISGKVVTETLVFNEEVRKIFAGFNEESKEFDRKREDDQP